MASVHPHDSTNLSSQDRHSSSVVFVNSLKEDIDIYPTSKSYIKSYDKNL